MTKPSKSEVDAVLGRLEERQLIKSPSIKLPLNPGTGRLLPVSSMTFADDEKQRLRTYCAQMTRYRLRRWWRRVLSLSVLLLATSAHAQQGPCGVQTGPLKPDLSVRISERRFTTETFSATSCPVREGVVTEGTHDLMRFTTTTPNTGDADLYLGAPATCPNLYEFDECHGHYHLKDYADYRLWTDAGWTKWVRVRNLSVPIVGTPNEAYLLQAQASGEVRIGRKQAFCILDFECLSNCYKKVDGVAGWFKVSTQQFPDCGTQGLTVGWQDEYSYLLDGQWVIMDGLTKGKKYVLEVQVNPDWVFQEKSYSNNADYVKFVY